MVRDRANTDSPHNEGLYHMEHWLAWLLALAAICLGVVGVIRGYGLIGGSFTSATAGPSGTQGAHTATIMDSIVWLLPAISAALLSIALHRNDHHRMMGTTWPSTGDKTLWNMEHMLAWIVAACAIAMGVIGIIVGFGLWIKGDTQIDGLPWLLASIAASGLTVTLHSVRHHQTVEEDQAVRMVQERVVVPGTTATPGVVREPGVERR